jgi:hypothetical protein
MSLKWKNSIDNGRVGAHNVTFRAIVRSTYGTQHYEHFGSWHLANASIQSGGSCHPFQKPHFFHSFTIVCHGPDPGRHSLASQEGSSKTTTPWPEIFGCQAVHNHAGANTCQSQLRPKRKGVSLFERTFRAAQFHITLVSSDSTVEAHAASDTHNVRGLQRGRGWWYSCRCGQTRKRSRHGEPMEVTDAVNQGDRSPGGTR